MITKAAFMLGELAGEARREGVGEFCVHVRRVSGGGEGEGVGEAVGGRNCFRNFFRQDQTISIQNFCIFVFPPVFRPK